MMKGGLRLSRTERDGGTLASRGQIICAFAFGVVFIVVMLAVAILIPYPSAFSYLVFRIIIALAAGGIAAVIPGFIAVDLPIGVRAGGALAAFAAVYFMNPASLSVQGFPTESSGVFVKELEEDRGLVEYYWKQADVRFRFPEDGWSISTRAARAGLGDLTLQHESSKDAQIHIHVSVLDDKYRESWNDFQANTISIWKGTIEQVGPVSTEDIFIDGRSAFRIRGSIRGEIQGTKKVDLIYAPLGDNRLLEMHLTRNDIHAQEADLLNAYDLIVSTIQFDR